MSLPVRACRYDVAGMVEISLLGSSDAKVTIRDDPEVPARRTGGINSWQVGRPPPALLLEYEMNVVPKADPWQGADP